MSTDHSTIEKITIELPQHGQKFARELFEILANLGKLHDNSLSFTASNTHYFPRVSLGIGSDNEAKVVFLLDNTKKITTHITNMTGVEKKSPHAYSHYSLTQVKKRLKGVSLTTIDHAGFNLPWFMGGTHPMIAFLQANLKSKCLYHTFPSGEAWDFIIPGTKDEIHQRSAIDYQETRKPKFELVSFEKSSTPLVQLDLATNTTYQTIKERFPEGLHVDELKQTWVYIQNPYAIDICLVLNEEHGGDWSEQFALTRLQ